MIKRENSWIIDVKAKGEPWILDIEYNVDVRRIICVRTIEITDQKEIERTHISLK